MTTTTTTTSFIFLFSLLPVILVVTTSIILDYALFYERILNRCQIQILMWLALSLSIRLAQTEKDDENEDDENSNDILVVFLAWGHLTLFFNLLVIMSEALQSRCLLIARSKQQVRNVLQIFPVSSWLSMIVAAGSIARSSTQKTTHSSTLFVISLQTFAGTFLVLWLVRLNANRRRKISRDMQGIPTTTTASATSNSNNGGDIMARFCGMGHTAASASLTSNSIDTPNGSGQYLLSWLDERRWYTWTRIQTIQWFAQQLSSPLGGDDDDTKEEKDMIITILTPHRITGDVLDGLMDVSQLVALQVPFGPACHLSDSIARLVDSFPKPQRNGNTRTRRKVGSHSSNYNKTRILHNDDENNAESFESNDCLNLHDQEYNTRRSQRMNEQRGSLDEESQQLQHPASSPVTEQQQQHRQHQHQHQHDPTTQGGMTDEHHEKLNNVMKERFGLELPKLTATDYFMTVKKGLSNNKNNNEMAPSSNNRLTQSHPLAAATAGTDQTNTSGLPYEGKQCLPPSRPLSSEAFPENILEGMPPQIREIAKRRPDLIQTILNQKQQESQATTVSDASRQRNFQLHPLSETAEEDTMVEEGRGNYDDSGSDSDDGNETTSLIHGDSNDFPIRYKSINKSIRSIV